MPHHSVSEIPSALERLKSVSLRGSVDFSHTEEIQEICKSLIVTDQQLRHMMNALLKSMETGLAAESETTASVKMLPSYVRAVPNGSETGNFLALDLGGTNFRVLLITLKGNEAEMNGKIFRVPESLMKGTGTALFDHIADCLAKFMEAHQLIGQKLPLGFTFSFPCQQHGLTSASLITWTKGFNATGVENQDVVQLLREACQRRKDIDIDVVAILNDTTGTLMACAFQENTTEIGVIVGTGTNACYMEKINKCPKLDGKLETHEGDPDEMIINTEWGGFGDDGAMDELRTDFDRQVDEGSINPGKQLFEKMISGMYMGEVARCVLERLAREGLLFAGDYEAIARPHCFPTKFVSEIEIDLKDEERTFLNTFQILEDIGIEKVSAVDCANVAYVCSLVSTRAAYLCAAGIATLINRMQKPHVTVGVDGSVFRFHPTFPTLLDAKIDRLVDEGLEFQLMLSEDGSGKGAALVAAVACRIEKERLERKSKIAQGLNGANGVK